MGKDKSIEKLEIIEDYGGEASFNDSWLDLCEKNAGTNIVRNFGWMQRKINELVDAVNKFSAEQDSLSASRLSSAVAEIRALREADREQERHDETQEAKEILQEILQKERVKLLIEQAHLVPFGKSEIDKRLRLLEMLIENSK